MSKQLSDPPESLLANLFGIYQSGNLLNTERASRDLLKAFPNSALLHNVLGVVLQEQGKPDLALQSFDKAISINRTFADAHSNRGNALKDLERLEESIEACDRAIQLDPHHAIAYNNRGNAQRDLGLLEDSMESCERAIQIQPDFAMAYNNRGNVFRGLGDLEMALESYDKAIRLDPDLAMAYLNRCDVLKDLGRLAESISSCKQALEIQPAYAEAHRNLGNAFLSSGKFEEAYDNYEKAIQIKPDYIEAYSNYLFSLNYSPEWTQEEIFNKHLEYEKQFGRSPLSVGQNLLQHEEHNRLRIGYLSPDFQSHSVSYFFDPLLRQHDNTAFEVYCYYNHTIEDSTTRRLMEEADHWRPIAGLGDGAAVELIKNDGIDILVDLVGHTGRNRLKIFTYKPALVQVAWLGYPNTTGLSAIDYRFTDHIADPIGEADQFYSENLVRLPNGFLCYQGNEAAEIEENPPCLNRGYITFGSFNNLTKVTPQVVKAWSEILNILPDAHLMLKFRQLVDPDVRNSYLSLFDEEGICADRIELLEYISNEEDHLALYNMVDIALDPFPYNGTTTTCEALWMGVPVITLCGDRHAGRVGASILTHVGLTQFIADDLKDYVSKAVQLAGKADELVRLKSGLRSAIKSSKLCDADAFAKSVENAYRAMWKAAKRGGVG